MADFLINTLVEILRVENVQSRFPDLVGHVGIIISAPIHPSTWFNIKMIDTNRSIKLQATGMKHSYANIDLIKDHSIVDRTMVIKQEKVMTKSVDIGMLFYMILSIIHTSVFLSLYVLKYNTFCLHTNIFEAVFIY